MPIPITIPATEMWDPVAHRFYDVKERTITMEHSLVSLSKWESKWKIPFIGNKNLTAEQLLSYFQCMTIEKNVNPMIYQCLTAKQIDDIMKYIDDSMTATWFGKSDDDVAAQTDNRAVTSELIYYWMFASGISKECEKWHLNRLITLIHVTSEENKPKKKRTEAERMAHHRALLKARRAKRNRH